MSRSCPLQKSHREQADAWDNSCRFDKTSGTAGKKEGVRIVKGGQGIQRLGTDLDTGEVKRIKDHILGGLWSKIDVIQVLYRC